MDARRRAIRCRAGRLVVVQTPGHTVRRRRHRDFRRDTSRGGLVCGSPGTRPCAIPRSYARRPVPRRRPPRPRLGPLVATGRAARPHTGRRRRHHRVGGLPGTRAAGNGCGHRRNRRRSLDGNFCRAKLLYALPRGLDTVLGLSRRARIPAHRLARDARQSGQDPSVLSLRFWVVRVVEDVEVRVCMHKYAQERIAIINCQRCGTAESTLSEKQGTAVTAIDAQIHRPHSTPISCRFPSTPLPPRQFLLGFRTSQRYSRTDRKLN